MSKYAFETFRNLQISERISYSMLPYAKLRSMEAGNLIWSRGDSVDAWRFVISGVVAMTTPVHQGMEMPIDVSGEGSWFGEQLIITGQNSEYDCSCITACQFMVLPSSVLQKLLESELRFAMQVIGMVSQRAFRKSEMLTLMKMGNPCLRVVRGIAQLAEAVAAGQGKMGREFDAEKLDLPVKQAVLAKWCGVSRTIMSEYLQLLQQYGFVEIEYGVTRLCQLRNWGDYLVRCRQTRVVNMAPTMDELLAELLKCRLMVMQAA